MAFELADLVDAVVGRAVDLHHVQALPRRDGKAVRTFTTRLVTVRRGTVQCLGQDAGDGGLAAAPGAGEEVSVANPPAGEGVTQDVDRRVLPHDLREGLRTILPV